MAIDPHEFLDAKKFSVIVERKALSPGIGYMDAILIICEEMNIDVEDVKSLLTKSLKAKVEAEAVNLNYLKGGNALPL